jgi:hypothetical protein
MYGVVTRSVLVTVSFMRKGWVRKAYQCVYTASITQYQLQCNRAHVHFMSLMYSNCLQFNSFCLILHLSPIEYMSPDCECIEEEWSWTRTRPCCKLLVLAARVCVIDVSVMCLNQGTLSVARIPQANGALGLQPGSGISAVLRVTHAVLRCKWTSVYIDTE